MTSGHILCTGGAGFIGTHTAVHLILSGYEVSVLDNFRNSKTQAIKRVEKICNKKIPIYNIDLRNQAELADLFSRVKFDGVIHYAALKSVGDSVEHPLEYYKNNLMGSLNLIESMEKVGCKILVFSSSATVYKPSDNPLTESSPLGASNPYGQTKIFNEQILKDVFEADKTKSWKISILRYFNPIGAHPSGLIGEWSDKPMNLLPTIQQVALKRRPVLNVYGNDWKTRDGTGVRDYIHVEDLAEGHVKALDKLMQQGSDGIYMIHNLGTGKGISVLEMVKSFEEASGIKIPLEFSPRRAGDLASVIADPSKANRELNWKATRTVEESCKSAWQWLCMNPQGYE